MGRKIPVVIFDSALKGEPGKDFLSFVATNNRRGGQMAGEHLAKLLGGKGKVVLLRYAVGSASTEEREAGFMEVIKAAPGITILSDNRYSGPTVATAKDEAMKLVDSLKQADGVFCPNESSTMGCSARCATTDWPARSSLSASTRLPACSTDFRRATSRA
jgi:ribose transport system substrate-binding protein